MATALRCKSTPRRTASLVSEAASGLRPGGLRRSFVCPAPLQRPVANLELRIQAHPVRSEHPQNSCPLQTSVSSRKDAPQEGADQKNPIDGSSRVPTAGKPGKASKTPDLGAWRDIVKLIRDPSKCVIASVAPSVRVTICDALDGNWAGAASLHNMEGEIVSSLRSLGFDYVFDTNFAADLTIVEEGTELLHRITESLTDPEAAKKHPLPMFTSCCPGWINLAEKSYPELLPHISTCKSPQGMQGSLIKTHFARKLGRASEDIVFVSIMPCVRKQGEADRGVAEAHVGCPADEGMRDVDFVITTVQFAAILKAEGIELATLGTDSFDAHLGISGGAAALFGTTGGVMEAAVRTVYELVTGTPLGRLALEEVRGLEGLRTTTLNVTPSPEGALGPALAAAGHSGPLPLRVGVVNGLGEAKKVVKAVQDGSLEVDFVEVMACPGGCIGGAGNPMASPEHLAERQRALYNVDERRTIRRSHENPAIHALYADFLGEPNSKLAHQLLHTHYVPGAPPAFDKKAAVEKKVQAASEQAPEQARDAGVTEPGRMREGGAWPLAHTGESSG